MQMNHLDIYYRALTDYRKQTGDDRECEARRKAIAQANSESDVIEVTTTVCVIDEAWVLAIEEGLVHIEKAIGEERQFIRSNGEVLPIEKVKRVSRDSVEHLARHSNLLTKETEGEGLVPDRLYTVERLSDYAVYENRFLYMLLCHLRDFIGLRYDKILDLTNTYSGSMEMNKVVSAGKRKIVCRVRLEEENRDDPFLKEHNASRALLGRIDMILKEVLHCLALPLMEQVSKAPMLKPPVVKTNVLKMNKNFKGAVALYDFISAYDGAGYTVEKRTKRINPFGKGAGDDFAETVALLSFLTYEHGLGIEEELKRAYEEEEARRRKEDERRLVEQIRALQKRIRASGMNAEEYMLLLEKRNRALESDSAQLAEARKEIDELNGEKEHLTQMIGCLNGKIEAQTAEIERINIKNAESMSALKREYELRAEELSAAHRAETEALKKAHAQETEALEALEGELRRQIVSEREESERKLSAEREECEIRLTAMREEHGEEIARISAVGEEREKEIDRLNGENKRLLDEKALSDGRLNALRKEHGLLTDENEFTSRSEFDELEHQYEVFKALFKAEWKKAKRRIRKEVLPFGFRKKGEAQEEEANGEKTEKEEKR